MRLSGVALTFLVFGHLFGFRVLVGLNQVSLGFVAAQWSGLGWRLYDLAMLFLATVQGANGLRGRLPSVRCSVRAWHLRWYVIGPSDGPTGVAAEAPAGRVGGGFIPSGGERSRRVETGAPPTESPRARRFLP
jgi:hypothetical protein